MQNSVTGNIHEIGGYLPPEYPQMSPQEQRAAMQAAKDKAEPNRANQGPVFTLHEEVELKGGRFEITRIGNDYIRLKPLPRHP